MNAQVELIVNGLSGSTAKGIIDLYGDEVITMNMSIANIKDIKQRKSTFSQSFVIPGTFVNCALTKPLTEENKLMYPYIYKQTESLSGMSGRPQVTIGVSYALFIPLLNY